MKLRLILLALLGSLVISSCVQSNPGKTLTVDDIVATLKAVSENNNKYMVTGSIDEGFSGLTYSLNAAEAKDVTLTSKDGKKAFSFEVALKKGLNELKLVADDGTTAGITKTLKQAYDPKALVLSVFPPTPPTNGPTTTVNGVVGPTISTLSYTLNGGAAQTVTFAQDRTFAFDVILNKGDNTIVVTADDAIALTEAAVKTVTVNYNPAALILSVTQPASPTDNATSTVTGFVGNNVTTLNYSLNGAAAQAATIAADKTFSFDVTLSEPSNTIAVTADDDNAATDAVTKTVTVAFAPVGQSMFRVLHTSPDAGNVDVLVDGTVMFQDIAMATLSNYMTVTEGQHRIEVNPTGSVSTVIEQTFDFVAKNQYTLLIEGTMDAQDGADLAAKFLMDNLAPKDGVAQTRVIHAASMVGAVDVYVTLPNATLASVTPFSLDYGQDNTLESSPGKYRVRVTPKGLKRVVYDTGALDFAAGTVQTVIATDATPVQLNVLSPDGMAVLPNVAGQDNGHVSGYVVNRRGGTPVADAVVSVPDMGQLTTTDANGYYKISLPAGYHTVMFSKKGSAGSKVDGLRVEAGKMTRYNTLQAEAYDPYMTTVSPQVTTNVTHGQTFTGSAKDDTFTIELEGTLSQPDANSFYRTIVGIGATAGDSGYLSKYVPRTILTFDGKRSTHTLSAAGFDGETTLHVVVYDQNTNRTEVIRYITLNSKAKGAAPVAPTKVFARAVTLADVAELGTLSTAPSADVFINALQYNDAEAMQELVEAAARANQENAHQRQRLQTQGYLDESVSWVDITFEYAGDKLPTAFEVFRQFENDPEPMLIGRIAAAKAKVKDKQFAFRDSTPGLQSGQKIMYTIDAVSGGKRASAAEGSETKVLKSFEIKIVSPEDGKTFTSVRPVYTMTYTNAADNVVAGVIALDRVQSDSFFVMGNRRFNLTQDAALQRFGGYLNKTGAAIPHRVLEILGGRPLAAHHTYDWQPVAMTTTVDDKGTEDTDDDVITAISVGADFYNLFGVVDLPRFGIKEVPASTFTTGDGTF